jgi:hypothetical protein
MSLLLAPLFAELISLQLGARTEARYVRLSDDDRYEGSASPAASLDVSSRRTSFQLSYAPLLTLAPLDTTPRQLYAFHQLSTTLSYRQQRTTFSLGSTLGIGSLNLRTAGVQGLQTANGMPSTDTATTGDSPTTDTPATGNTPTTGTPAAGAPPTTPGGPITEKGVTDQKVRFYVSTTTLSVAHRLTRDAQFTVMAGSSMANGRDQVSRQFYPGLRGWSLGGNTSYTYALSRRDRFTGIGSLIKTWSSNGNESATLGPSVSWSHQFDLRTVGTSGAGLNITRFSLSDGLAGFSVFPTFNLGISHQVRVGRGGLSFSATAYSSPALDPLRALVDPRVGLSGSIGYTRKKLSVTTTGGAQLSVAPAGNDRGAVNSTQGEARLSYQLGKLAALDTGARVTHQTYAGQNVVPTTWAAFVGLTFGYSAVLAGSRK